MKARKSTARKSAILDDVDQVALRRKSMLDGTDLYGPKQEVIATHTGVAAAAREAVRNAPEQRSEDDVTAILKFVQEVEFLAQLNEFQLRGLCKTMRHEQFKKWDVIFSWQDEGEKFYIVVAGRLEVRVPNKAAPCPNDEHPDIADCTCMNREMVLGGYLEQGNGFGELALINDKPRAATIIAQEECHLLVVTREEYKKFVSQYHKEYLDQRVKYLKEIPQIEEALELGTVSEQDVGTMANCLTQMQYNGNAVVAQQGELVDRIIFVRSGQLTMIRAVDVCMTDSSQTLSSPRGRRRGMTLARARPTAVAASVASSADLAPLPPQPPDVTNEETEEEHTQHPAEEVGPSEAADSASPEVTEKAGEVDSLAELSLETEITAPDTEPSVAITSPLVVRPSHRRVPAAKRKLLRAGVVGAYQYFGEQQFQKGESFPVSLVSEAMAFVFVANKQDLVRRIPKNVMAALLTGTEIEVVPDEKLLEMHAHTERWHAYCQDLHNEALSRREEVTTVRRSRHAGTVPTGPTVMLTRREHEFFSDASSSFLRRCGEIGSDKRLQSVLRGDGSQHSRQQFLPAADDDEHGPMNFRFENQWSRMGEGIIVHDLEQVLSAQQNLPVLRTDKEKFQRRKSLSRLLNKQVSFGKSSTRHSLGGHSEDGCGSSVESPDLWQRQHSSDADGIQSMSMNSRFNSFAEGQPSQSDKQATVSSIALAAAAATVLDEDTRPRPRLPMIAKPGRGRPQMQTSNARPVMQVTRKHGPGRRCLVGSGTPNSNSFQRFPPYHDRNFRRHLR